MPTGIRTYEASGFSALTVHLTFSFRNPCGAPSGMRQAATAVAGRPGPYAQAPPIARAPPLPLPRLRPSPPPLSLAHLPFSSSATAEIQALSDVPVQVHRRRELHRALGLTAATAHPPPSGGSSGSRSPGGRPPGTSQYQGKLSVVEWNTQALFAVEETRHRDKARHVHHLMATHDVGCWSESHGTADRGAAWREPLGCRSWWSPGPTTGSAGVGITVRKEFLRLFEHRVHFEVIFPGRAAVLRLEGSQGSLDIYSIYMHTGDCAPLADVLEAGYDPNGRNPSNFELREVLRRRIARAMRPRDLVHSILAGDFNYVARPTERTCTATATATGHRDQRDSASWRSLLEIPFGIHDLYQPEPTYASPNSRARLDRIHSNQHQVEYLDKSCSCTALQWRPELSRHRPLSFRKCLAPDRSDRPRVLNDQIMAHPDFPRQVTLALQEAMRADPSASALGQLRMVKEAMRTAEAAIGLQLEASQPAEPLEDRIGVAMRFLRASEAGCPERVSKCLVRYPLLRDLVSNPYDFSTAPGPRLDRVRRHIIELQTDFTMQELRGLHEDLHQLEPDKVARRRRQNLRLVSKLAPGRSCQQFAMDTPSGAVTTDPQEMVRLLRAHWSQVFTDKPIDVALMTAWLEEDAAHLPPDFREHLPHLRVPLRIFRQAIKMSGNSAPGRDGIPFRAWRRILDLAAPLLQAALEEMVADGGLERIREEWAA